MDLTPIVMWLGFALASYSVVGNDVIQTLGTFLTSNENRVRWYVLWTYAAVILTVMLLYGHLQQDVTYGRLDKFTFPEVYAWYYLLPPLVLLTITRMGIPVSTTFMILTLFSLQKIPADLNAMVGSIFDTHSELGGMIYKSVMGYLIAFAVAILVYLLVTNLVERRFIDRPATPREQTVWTVLQWFSTGFLWSQWLIQDLANIYIYMRGGYTMSTGSFLLSLGLILGLLAYIFYSKGGAVQDVVRRKTNTADIRSATIIDFIYGIVLFVFKDDYFGLWGGKLPMSTTWVFVGLLAGRELGLRLRLEKKISLPIARMILGDLAKVFAGLVVSVVLVFIIKLLAA